MTTVGKLAEQLGISLKEAVALCVVCGIQVHGADTTLTPADVARVHDVLEGRVHLPDPKLTGVKKPPAGYSRKVSSTGTFLAVIVVVFLLVGGAAAAYLVFGRGDTRVLKALPGDCFNAQLFGLSVLPSSVEVVPCTGPHNFRAFGTIDLDQSYKDFPGFDEIRQHAQDRCPFLAGAAGATRETILFLGPGDERAWRDPGAHKIICASRDQPAKR